MPEIRRTLTIRNKLGLHARAATKLAKLSHEFAATIHVRQGDKEVDASSVMGLLLLASQQGRDIEIIASGDEAEAALDAIEKLIQDKFDEEA
ncbi:HPr family phosphocarrier protein [Aliidiomarina taiwanensis]|uniref:HPr family phosphocarrier protein n=1 Tax=Aliidiomarina taiwanensis TaxID=946228 RepID=A0A432X7K9_9GAMM|nr:HPr family phosphocarrier protein [Aliidiomarina taiwanensis]RUO42849.1 HPr family phosphocarrier protein [Aliidiomarina taiwanensis]